MYSKNTDSNEALNYTALFRTCFNTILRLIFGNDIFLHPIECSSEIMIIMKKRNTRDHYKPKCDDQY